MYIIETITKQLNVNEHVISKIQSTEILTTPQENPTHGTTTLFQSKHLFWTIWHLCWTAENILLLPYVL